MTPEQIQRVEDLRKWRLNQPYMTSEEFAEQVKTIRRNVAARSMNETSLNETPPSYGRGKQAASSTDASI